MMTPNEARRKSAKHDKAIAALKRATYKLVDMQFEAERASWEGRDRGEQNSRGLSVDCTMVIGDLSMTYAASFSSTRPVAFEVRQIHRDMHPTVLALVTRLATELEDIELSDYPGGPDKARLHGIIGRVGIMANNPTQWPAAEIADVLARAEARRSELPKSTIAHMEKLADHCRGW